MTTPAPGEDAVISAIRTNVVFEKMILSVLTVAVASGAAHWMIGFSTSGFAAHALGSSLMAALTFMLLFFFAAFAACVAVGIPLFLQMEKRRLRKAWPYVLAAIAVSMLVLSAAGAAPSFDEPWRALLVLPGTAVAMLFARKMRPFWASAERSDAASAAAVMRLH